MDVHTIVDLLNLITPNSLPSEIKLLAFVEHKTYLYNNQLEKVHTWDIERLPMTAFAETKSHSKNVECRQESCPRHL